MQLQLLLLLPERKKKVIASHVTRRITVEESQQQRDNDREILHKYNGSSACLYVCECVIIIMKINISTLHVSRQLVDKRAK